MGRLRCHTPVNADAQTLEPSTTQRSSSVRAAGRKQNKNKMITVCFGQENGRGGKFYLLRLMSASSSAHPIRRRDARRQAATEEDLQRKRSKKKVKTGALGKS